MKEQQKNETRLIYLEVPHLCLCAKKEDPVRSAADLRQKGASSPLGRAGAEDERGVCQLSAPWTDNEPETTYEAELGKAEEGRFSSGVSNSRN